MRLLGKILLGVSLVISFWVLLVSVTSKFQLMDPNFWIASFRNGSVYTKVDYVLAQETEKIFLEEGATLAEAKQMSRFFESSNLQTFTEKNIFNALDYINHKSDTLFFYFPLAQLPVEIRTDLNLTSDQISVNKLISTFGQNSTPAGEEFFIQLRALSTAMTITLVVAVITILIHIFLLYRIETPNHRLKGLGISLIASGALTLLVIFLLNNFVTSASKDLTLPDKETVQIVSGTLAPPVIFAITKLWTIIAFVTIILGAISLFIKKGGVNIPSIHT